MANCGKCGKTDIEHLSIEDHAFKGSVPPRDPSVSDSTRAIVRGLDQITNAEYEATRDKDGVAGKVANCAVVNLDEYDAAAGFEEMCKPVRDGIANDTIDLAILVSVRGLRAERGEDGMPVCKPESSLALCGNGLMPASILWAVMHNLPALLADAFYQTVTTAIGEHVKKFADVFERAGIKVKLPPTHGSEGGN